MFFIIAIAMLSLRCFVSCFVVVDCFANALNRY